MTIHEDLEENIFCDIDCVFKMLRDRSYSYSANCTAILIDVDNNRGALSPQMWPYSRIEWAWGAAKARKVCCNSVHGQYGVEEKRHSYIVQHPGVNPSSVRAVASTTCHGDEIEARQGAVCMCIACRW